MKRSANIMLKIIFFFKINFPQLRVFACLFNNIFFFFYTVQNVLYLPKCFIRLLKFYEFKHAGIYRVLSYTFRPWTSPCVCRLKPSTCIATESAVSCSYSAVGDCVTLVKTKFNVIRSPDVFINRIKS